MTETKES